MDLNIDLVMLPFAQQELLISASDNYHCIVSYYVNQPGRIKTIREMYADDIKIYYYFSSGSLFRIDIKENNTLLLSFRQFSEAIKLGCSDMLYPYESVETILLHLIKLYIDTNLSVIDKIVSYVLEAA